MASSGTINNTFRTGYAIRVVWSVDSQDVASNTSTVTASVQLVSLGSSYTINSSASKSGSLTINGTQYSFTFNASLSGNQAKTIFTKTVKVAHNADGSKTCAFACTAGINVTLSGTYYSNVSASGSGVFDTIPRASSISSLTASVAVNGTNAVTINISRASTAFTHTVVISFGVYAQTITGVATSTSYAIPMNWLHSMANATSGTATVTVTTYNGSTKIGSAVSQTFTLTAPASVVPTISAVSITEGTEGIAAQFGAFVQGKSTVKVAITAAGTYSSTIKSYKTVMNNLTYHSASFTTGVLTFSGTLNFTVTVTDSRGRTATYTTSKTIVEYAAPTISTFTVFRANGLGSADYEGTMVNARVKFSVSPVGNKNIKSYKVEYKLKTSTTWTEAVTGSVYAYDNTMLLNVDLSPDYSYDIRLTLTDYFGSVMAAGTIPTAYTLLDFNASGKGLAFGKVSERSNAMEINMDIFDRYGTQIRNGLAYYLSGGAIDANTTTEELVLTTTNTPIEGAFFYVRTMFYSTKSATANRTQLAYPYNKAMSTYYRYYINGTGWSAWIEQPVITSQGTSGIWTYREYSDGTAECVGKINVTAADVTTALGGWFRGANLYEATTYPYPVTFTSAPATQMMFQTRNASAALLWVFSQDADTAKVYLPQCYLIRPVSGTGITGNVNIIAKGNI